MGTQRQSAPQFETGELESVTKDNVRALKPKALIYFVDDEPDILEVFDACFSRKFQVKTFLSAYDLVDQVASGTVPVPSLIVTDLRMAKMDGVKMLATLHALGHEVPAILLSGNLDKSAAVEAINHGFFRILEKPFEPATLEAHMNDLLMEAHVHRIRSEVRAHVRQLTEIYQAMRLLLGDKIENFDAILDSTMQEAGQSESFDAVVGRLERRLDELLKVEEITEGLRKTR